MNWTDLRCWARQQMAGAPAGHGWDHVERVERLALQLAGQVGARTEVVRAAALLHDVGREVEARTGEDHAVISARWAREQLPAWGFPAQEVEAVCACIEEHRFQGSRAPGSPESQVLSDADKLDALGAFGLYRLFSTGAVRGRSLQETLQHCEEKLLHLEDCLHTALARHLARDRTERLRVFLKWLEEEASVSARGQPRK